MLQPCARVPLAGFKRPGGPERVWFGFPNVTVGAPPVVRMERGKWRPALLPSQPPPSAPLVVYQFAGEATPPATGAALPQPPSSIGRSGRQASLRATAPQLSACRVQGGGNTNAFFFSKICVFCGFFLAGVFCVFFIFPGDFWVFAEFFVSVPNFPQTKIGHFLGQNCLPLERHSRCVLER